MAVLSKPVLRGNILPKKKIKLHVIREPFQRTLHWVKKSGNISMSTKANLDTKTDVSKPMIIDLDKQNLSSSEDIYGEQNEGAALRSTTKKSIN